MRIDDQALVLRRTPFRESSLILHLYTRRHGLRSALARGVRGGGRSAGRVNERRAALAGFHTLAIDLRARSEEGLAVLCGVETVTTRHRLPGDAGALAAAQLLLEAVYRFMAPGDPRAEVFAGLEWAVDALESGLDSLTVAGLALRRLLRDLGYGWRTDCCAGCGCRERLVFFSVRRSQVVCDHCGAPYANRLQPLNEKTLDAMERLEWSPGFGLLSREEGAALYRMGIASLERLGGRPLLADRTFRRLAGLENHFRPRVGQGAGR